MSHIAPQHKYTVRCPQGVRTQSHKDQQGMKIIKKIAKSVTSFFTVIVNGVIEGRQRQAEYIARNHHWY
jgi:hypothetical protein